MRFPADFLRLSRGALDDSITQNLNALATPAARGFDLLGHGCDLVAAARRQHHGNAVARQFPQFPVATDYDQLRTEFATAAEALA